MSGFFIMFVRFVYIFSCGCSLFFTSVWYFIYASTADAHVGCFPCGDAPTVPCEHSVMYESVGEHICPFLLGM